MVAVLYEIWGTGMVRRSFSIVLLWLVLPALWAGQGFEIRVLQSENEIPAVGVLVEVRNEDTGFVQERKTNDQGKARFEGLAPVGRYFVRVPGDAAYYEVVSEPLTLRANFTRSVVLYRVPLLVTDESLIVNRTITEVNGTNAEVSSTLREQEIRELPVEGRDVTRALYRLPNVTQATGFFPEAPNVSINGANSLYTNYMIDGMDNNENFLGGQKFPIPVGFTRNITVLTNNYSTEFGRTGNGVFNMTSKSGGNRLEGEVFYTGRPGPSLDASSSLAQRDLSGNQVKDGFRRDQFGFGLGGAITKDRTFYYVNVEQTRDDKDNLLNSPSLGVNTTVPGENRFDFYSLKLDHFWNENWHSSLRSNISQVAVERQGGGLEGGVLFPSAGDQQDRNAALIAWNNTFVNDRLVFDTNLQYSRFRWDYANPVNGPGPQVTVLDSSGMTAAVLGHPGYVFDSLEKTWQLQQKVTFFAGNHTLKAGYDLIRADFDLFGGGNVNGNYLVRLTPAQEAALVNAGLGAGLGINDIPSDVAVLDYAVELRPSAFGETQDLIGLYVEDQWAVGDKLDVVMGLRYDYDSLSEGGSTSADSDNIAPRLSVNYALDDGSIIRAGAGLFYEKIPYAIYSDALQQNSVSAGFRGQLQSLIDQGILPADTDLERVTFMGNLTVNPTDVSYLNGPTPADASDLAAAAFSNERRILNPNGYDNPYTWQFSLGYQRQLGRDYLFYVDAMMTRSENLFRLRDLNAPASYQITAEQAANLSPEALQELVRSQEEADASRPVAPVPGGARGIIVSESEGSSHYKALNLNLIKDRGDDAYSYRLSYTLSRLRNNTEDINFRAEDANDFGAEWGPSINDRTHVISAFGSWHFQNGFVVSLAALLQSGQPINRIPDAAVFGTTDLNGDGRSFGDAYVGNSDRYPGESRNSDRLPWSESVDLGLSYEYDVAGLNQIVFRADIFNLFNHENLSGYTNNATQSNQIQIGPSGTGIVRRNAGPPRQFQFSVQYRF